MNWFEAVILGIIQGITEFLPISSSGHLVLAQHFMDIHETGIFLEVILHMGTLAAILIYFRYDLSSLIMHAVNGMQASRTYLIYLGVSTAPIACAGLYLDGFIESFFIPSVTICMLMITGFILASTYFVQNRPIKKITLFMALFIGIVQTFALIPGISRSGITISVALLIGMHHREAAKFSFFMAIPTLLGVGFIQIMKIDNWQQITAFPLIMGFLSATISGYLVIDWFLAVISRGKFHLFSLYCFTISIIAYLSIN